MEKQIEIKPKFFTGQKVWKINRNKSPFRYDMPLLASSLGEGFEEFKILVILVSNYRSGKDKVGIGYSGWSNNTYREKDLWATKDEAIKANQKQFNIEKKKFLEDKKKEKVEQKERLLRELKEL